MKKTTILLHYIICFLITFALIYLYIFVGGWRLFESGDAIMIELGVSTILSWIIFVFFEIVFWQSKRIESLEERLAALEVSQQPEC